MRWHTFSVHKYDHYHHESLIELGGAYQTRCTYDFGGHKKTLLVSCGNNSGMRRKILTTHKAVSGNLTTIHFIHLTFIIVDYEKIHFDCHNHNSIFIIGCICTNVFFPAAAVVVVVLFIFLLYYNICAAVNNIIM